MHLNIVLPLLFVGSAAVAKPDIAGTKTVVISLATGESGQIIPFVLHRNSHGFDPITIYASEYTYESPFSATGSASSEESIVVSIVVPSAIESSEESLATELHTEVSATESSADETGQGLTVSVSAIESSVAEPSVSEQASTTGEDLGSGSDSDSDNEESKSVAVNSTSHISKKSAASTHIIPNAAFLAISACLFAVSINRIMF